jgi:hypothetical protein
LVCTFWQKRKEIKILNVGEQRRNARKNAGRLIGKRLKVEKRYNTIQFNVARWLNALKLIINKTFISSVIKTIQFLKCTLE